MTTGKPLFPGADVSQQCELIFKYPRYFITNRFRLLGTPTDQALPDIANMPGYKIIFDFPLFPAQKLQDVIPDQEPEYYTLLSVPCNFTIRPLSQSTLSYDPLKRIQA